MSDSSALAPVLQYRVGIDLGGTKIEIIVLKNKHEIYRHRVSTPSTYLGILSSLAELFETARPYCLVDQAELVLGIGMPGAITDKGLVKNSNTVCLNGKSFVNDLEATLGLPIKVMNDANCFALSESVDGAGTEQKVVFAVILGTGVGGAIVIDKVPLQGLNSIAGEWGHNPFSPRAPVSSEQQRHCYCGQYNCVETFLSGQGLLQTYRELVVLNVSETAGKETVTDVKGLVALSMLGDSVAIQTLALYVQQLAANLAKVINIVDPNVIVLGGGLSNIPSLAEKVTEALGAYVFTDEVKTQVRRNCHGDSSGVRGAAWL